MDKKKIIAVDDEPLILGAIKDTLENDFDIITASAGLEALEMIEKHKPDLVIMDVLMPDIDGFEVVRRLHTTRPPDNPPVIFLSAKIGQGDIDRGLNLGGFDYMSKPFSPTKLVKTVNEVLERIELRKKIQQQKKKL